MRTLVIFRIPPTGYRLGTLAMAIAIFGFAISQVGFFHLLGDRDASDSNDADTVLMAGRGEESDKCEWLGNCDD
ncbi:hypothetical protein [Baaleninema simplex]|uniref:hypothetical protein n=1 Tax=Baaleninema simplex TaxID=2862350 RepID=UPI001181BE02|nr:hypothetical protein [Baaleninema simplex]